MNFLKKYICELVFAINIFLIPFNHDFKTWWQRPIVNDAMGYYAYLPAVFIYQDLTYNSIEEPWLKHNKYVPIGNSFKDSFVIKYKGKEVNKYPPGVTYFEASFFFAAHACALIFNFDADGYSDIYMYFMCIGAIFWQYFFFRILLRIFKHYDLSANAFALTVPLISFGTNLYFYTQIFGCYSHIYTLISVSLYFYFGLKFFESFPEQKSGKYFFGMLVSFALAVITRNINVIALLLLPCMGFRLKDTLHYFGVLKSKWGLAGLFFSFALIFSMLLLWKLQTGYWLIDSYPDEHFNFAKPQLFKSLFSAHKGWFFYTPLALLSILGLFLAPRKLAVNLFLFLALVIYITSSWGTWDYGTGFSMRAYIDWYLIIAIGLGFLIEWALSKKVLSYALGFAFTLCMALNLLWSEQFMRGIISGTSQGIEYTVKNFFRLRSILEFQISKRTIVKSTFVKEDFNADPAHPFTELNNQIRFSKGIRLNLQDYLKGNSYTAIRYGGEIKLKDLKNEILLCVSLTGPKDTLLLWNQTNIIYFPKINEWEKVESGFLIPSNIPKECTLSVFFWQPTGNTVGEIHNMYVEFVEAVGE